MTLDTPTIVVLATVINVVLLFVMVHAWCTRTTYSGVAAWVVGTACWTIGCVLTMLLFKQLPPFFSKIIGNGLTMLSPMLLFEGLLQFHDIRRHWWDTPLNIALFLPALILQAYFLYVVDDIAARIIVVNVFIAVMAGRVAVEPLCYRLVRRHFMQWLLSLTMIPMIVLFWLRVAGASNNMFFGMSMDAVMSQDVLLRQILFCSIILEIVIAYSYLSLTSDRVEEELTRSEKSYRELTLSLQGRVEEEAQLRLVQERTLANQSRMAAMGEMISVIAHQWRQPLGTLGMIIQRTYVVGVRQGLTPAYLDEFKASAMRQVRYMSDTIEEFRGFYRPGKQHELFSPYDCIADSVRLFEPQFTGNAIVVAVQRQPGGDRLVDGYPNEFKQVILNLLGNARDAIQVSRKTKGIPENGHIDVQISLSSATTMAIDISDNGCGISADISQKIFNPYYTTKEKSGGTGIGLYMSRMIVEDSLAGRLILTQSLPTAIFRIELPLEKLP